MWGGGRPERFGSSNFFSSPNTVNTRTPPPDPAQLLTGVLILHTCTLFVRAHEFYGWPDKNTVRTDVRKRVYIGVCARLRIFALLNRTSGYTTKNQICRRKMPNRKRFYSLSRVRRIRHRPRRRQGGRHSQSFIAPSTASGGRRRPFMCLILCSW